MAYRKPPITEAVIELRYKNLLDQKIVETVAKRLADEYPFDEQVQQLNLIFDTGSLTTTKVDGQIMGIKLSSVDRTDIIIMGRHSFVCSRLAPYTGWEEFSAKTRSAWDEVQGVAGNPELSRIGVRYLNRIDVPMNEQSLLEMRSYLNVYPVSPDDLGGPLNGYTLQVGRPLGVDDCQLLITSATVPSPLVGFGSLLLDMDISREVDLPRRPEDIWALLNRVRQHKNRIFESCITDAARKLFE